MQYLDALESLRTQGFPDEPVISRRYEILQRFMEGVRNGDLRRNLATMYAHEHYLNDPPTVEALRYATQQYMRTRGPPAQSQPRPQPQQRFAATRAAPPMDNQQTEEGVPAAPQPLQSVPQEGGPQRPPFRNFNQVATGHALSVNKLVTLPGSVPIGNTLWCLNDPNSLQRKLIGWVQYNP